MCQRQTTRENWDTSVEKKQNENPIPSQSFDLIAIIHFLFNTNFRSMFGCEGGTCSIQGCELKR